MPTHLTSFFHPPPFLTFKPPLHYPTASASGRPPSTASTQPRRGPQPPWPAAASWPPRTAAAQGTSRAARAPRAPLCRQARCGNAGPPPPPTAASGGARCSGARPPATTPALEPLCVAFGRRATARSRAACAHPPPDAPCAGSRVGYFKRHRRARLPPVPPPPSPASRRQRAAYIAFCAHRLSSAPVIAPPVAGVTSRGFIFSFPSSLHPFLYPSWRPYSPQPPPAAPLGTPYPLSPVPYPSPFRPSAFSVMDEGVVCAASARALITDLLGVDSTVTVMLPPTAVVAAAGPQRRRRCRLPLPDEDLDLVDHDDAAAADVAASVTYEGDGRPVLLPVQPPPSPPPPRRGDRPPAPPRSAWWPDGEEAALDASASDSGDATAEPGSSVTLSDGDAGDGGGCGGDARLAHRGAASARHRRRRGDQPWTPTHTMSDEHAALGGGAAAVGTSSAASAEGAMAAPLDDTALDAESYGEAVGGSEVSTLSLDEELASLMMADDAFASELPTSPLTPPPLTAAVLSRAALAAAAGTAPTATASPRGATSTTGSPPNGVDTADGEGCGRCARRARLRQERRGKVGAATAAATAASVASDGREPSPRRRRSAARAPAAGGPLSSSSSLTGTAATTADAAAAAADGAVVEIVARRALALGVVLGAVGVVAGGAAARWVAAAAASVWKGC